MSDVTPTRSAWLELREEREGMQEGYRFLDEKRLVLAAEILQQLRQYERLMAKFRSAYNDAARALKGAVFRHGLQGVEHYPPRPSELEFAIQQHAVLGVAIQEAQCAQHLVSGQPRLSASPEGEQCADRFARLLPIAGELAVIAANLERLRDEYRRTARRARALEDVLLPEIDADLERIDTALEEFEKEEAVRVKMMHPD